MKINTDTPQCVVFRDALMIKNMDIKTEIETKSTDETRALGARLAAVAAVGDVYSLDGDLGAGKTEFVRGFVEALAQKSEVRSPTFSIVNIYQAPRFPIYHFDFYRIEDEREFGSIGLGDYIYGDGVCLIEWGALYKDALPDHTKHILFRYTGESTRIVTADFSF